MAADAYRDLEDGSGERPRQVRVISAPQLQREGGQREVSLADADVVRLGAQAPKTTNLSRVRAAARRLGTVGIQVITISPRLSGNPRLPNASAATTTSASPTARPMSTSRSGRTTRGGLGRSPVISTKATPRVAPSDARRLPAGRLSRRRARSPRRRPSSRTRAARWRRVGGGAHAARGTSSRTHAELIDVEQQRRHRQLPPEQHADRRGRDPTTAENPSATAAAPWRRDQPDRVLRDRRPAGVGQSAGQSERAPIATANAGSTIGRNTTAAPGSGRRTARAATARSPPARGTRRPTDRRHRRWCRARRRDPPSITITQIAPSRFWLPPAGPYLTASLRW